MISFPFDFYLPCENVSTINSRKFRTNLENLGIWATIIVLQRILWNILTTIDLSPFAIPQNMVLAVNLVNSNVFSENMGRPQPIKIIII